MKGLLEGLRVVEGSAFVAAPLAGMTMAQLGADVIRFDRIRGGLGTWCKRVVGPHYDVVTAEFGTYKAHACA